MNKRLENLYRSAQAAYFLGAKTAAKGKLKEAAEWKRIGQACLQQAQLEGGLH